MIRIALAALLLATPALAQDEPRLIPPEEWVDMVGGQTVYYEIEGEPYGREYYAPDGESVVFEHVSGACLEGRWTYFEPLEAYCFAWPGETSCFRHFEQDGARLIQGVEPDGTLDTESLQEVGRIVPVPLTCEPGVTS
ncbi:hypothetical protein [Roseobacter sp. HKCCA0434]|uniref:hypothetical protein n=1 Tax=Roseobacter sp. HKCCA0434 TaxID=3079297 RepID=UPI002905A2C7|nr:hypothetical protein [Roseobacter sp. HKCCA0434]